MLKNLLKRLKLPLKGKPERVKIDNIDPAAARNCLAREIELLGEDRVKRQRYYEAWACRESWLIYEEALPLLVNDAEQAGSDDGTNDTGGEQDSNINSLWEHIQQCVKQGLPPDIINPADPPESWRAEPVEIYRWAVAARQPIPDDLEGLLAFVSTAVKRDSGIIKPSAQGQSGESERDVDGRHLAREQVLDAMLCLALREIMNAQAIDADALRVRILDQLYNSAEFLFGQPEPPLTRPALHDLFDRSLEKAMNR